MIRPGKMIREVLCSLLKKPATGMYPFVKTAMPDRYRGKLAFQPDRCIGCKLCMRDCPSDAIHITKLADKQFSAELEMNKCIYCGQCVDSCPKQALEMSSNFELAALDRAHLKVNLRQEAEAAGWKPAPPAPPAAASSDAKPDQSAKK